MKVIQRVLVTRSEPAASRLGTVIDQAGFHALVYPLIAIEACSDRNEPCIAARIQQLDIVIAVSVNAVHFAQSLLSKLRVVQESGRSSAPKPTLLGIGRATIHALQGAGLQVEITRGERPLDGARSSGRDERMIENSETLLASRILRNVRGKNVLILSGVGGRSLLADTLVNRGAVLSQCHSYRRVLLEWPEDRQTSITGVAAVVISSGEAFTAFHAQWNRFGGSPVIPLIVPNERVMSMAREQGFGNVISSEGAGDKAVVLSLKRVLNDRTKSN